MAPSFLFWKILFVEKNTVKYYNIYKSFINIINY